MKLRKRNFKKEGEVQNFWPSFTDVMATVVLVLFFLMLLIYLQYIMAGNKLKKAADDLEQKNIQLLNLEESLNASKLEITRAMEELAFLETELDNKKAEIEQGQKELNLSYLEIAKQRQIIANSNQELSNLRAKLQNIAVLRLDILTKVKNSIEDQIGKTNDKGQPLVTVGENANLVINESLLFDFGSSEINNDGKKLLNQFAIAFENILDDADIRDFIDTINIDGHADSVGFPSNNMRLASERAYKVLNYIMSANKDLENKGYARYFAASGFSEHRPIEEGDSEEARRKNRRIEISINIKDSNIQNIIEEYLNEAGNAN